uniref:Uncharacterized protein n=1 Tax=Caenorhabditis japonica TaxID=281687 RepID=A0A8R1IU90_CAEJA
MALFQRDLATSQYLSREKGYIARTTVVTKIRCTRYTYHVVHRRTMQRYGSDNKESFLRVSLFKSFVLHIVSIGC